MSKSWWDAFENASPQNPDDVRACLEAMEAGLRSQQQKITAIINSTPEIDRPLLLAALRMTYEAVLGSDRQLREVTEAVLDLPIHTVIAVRKNRTAESGTDGKTPIGGSAATSPGGGSSDEIEARWIPGAPEALGRYMCLLRGNADGPDEPDKEFRVDVKEDGPYLFGRPILRGYIITAHWPLPPLGGAKEV